MTLRLAESPADLIRESVTVEDVATRLRLDPSMVRRMVRRGDLASWRVGRAIRIYVDSVQAFQERAASRPDGGTPVPPSTRVPTTAAHREAVAGLRRLGIL